jgi:hypothetical protein
MFPIQNGLKQGDALLPLLSAIQLEYDIMTVIENQDTSLNGTHLLLVNYDDVNLLGENLYKLKKSTETLLDVD